MCFFYYSWLSSNQKEENYLNLSMVDSYILHLISRIDNARNTEKLNNDIKRELEKNDIILRKSIYYAAHPYNN